jgi:hypothetical protein
MSEHFREVYECVDNYFKMSLKQGRSVLETMESFREDPLPADLTMCKFQEDEIRRHGQLVSTKYVIEAQQQESRKLPLYDPVSQ